jgi:hypothetical protein
MNRLRQRKLTARENRQASLHSQGTTVEKTVIKVPQPKALEKKETVKVEKNVKESKSKKVLEVVKRGRGRPPKDTSKLENKKALVGTKIKTIKSKGRK